MTRDLRDPQKLGQMLGTLTDLYRGQGAAYGDAPLSEVYDANVALVDCVPAAAELPPQDRYPRDSELIVRTTYERRPA